MKKVIICFIGFCVVFHLSSPSHAYDKIIKSKITLGQKESLIDEEQEEDNDYNFTKFKVSINQDINPKLSYFLSYQKYDKNYSAQDNLDNRVILLKNNWIYNLKSYENLSHKIELSFSFLGKDFTNDNAQTYKRWKLNSSYKIEQYKDFLLRLSLGGSHYNFTNNTSNNDGDMSVKIDGAKFLDNLVIASYLKFTNSSNSTSGKQLTFKIGANYNIKQPLIEEIKINYLRSKRNSREIDDSDYNLDYLLHQFNLVTNHDFIHNLKTTFNFGYLTKDYVNANYDQTGFNVGIKTKMDLWHTSYGKIYSKLGYEFKTRNYPLSSTMTYTKHDLKLGAALTKRQDYSIKTNISSSFLRFPNSSQKDRNNLSFKITGSKYLWENFILESCFNIKKRFYLRDNDSVLKTFYMALTYKI